MSDERNFDLEALLSSPLRERDREPRAPRDGGGPPAWLPTAGGVVVGIAAVAIGFFAARSGDEAAATTTIPVDTTVTTTTAPDSGPADGDVAAYPAGYVEVTDLVAIKATTARAAGDGLYLGFTSAVRRGFDPGSSTPFTFGRWILDTASGARLESIATQADASVPGAFTVLFPWEGDPGEIEQVTLVERWDRRFESDTIEIEFTGFPFTAGPILAAGGTIELTGLTLDEESGEVSWSSPAGSELNLAGFSAGTDDGAFWGATSNQGFFSGFVIAQPEGTEGSATLSRLDQSGVTLEPGDGLTLEVTVTVFDPEPASVAIDLAGLQLAGT